MAMTSQPRRWSSMTTSFPSSPEPRKAMRVADGESGVPMEAIMNRKTGGVDRSGPNPRVSGNGKDGGPIVAKAQKFEKMSLSDVRTDGLWSILTSKFGENRSFSQ